MKKSKAGRRGNLRFGELLQRLHAEKEPENGRHELLLRVLYDQNRGGTKSTVDYCGLKNVTVINIAE
jgi:hypothetical protein